MGSLPILIFQGKGSSNFNFISMSSGHHLFMDPFVFRPSSSVEISKALKTVDAKQSTGCDNLDPYHLKLAADFIAEPIVRIFDFVFRQI